MQFFYITSLYIYNILATFNNFIIYLSNIFNLFNMYLIFFRMIICLAYFITKKSFNKLQEIVIDV